VQSENRFFDDFARMASGAMNGLGALKTEMEAQMRQHVETFLGRMNLVRREEFDVAQAMIVKARDEQEALVARVAALEQALAAAATQTPARAASRPRKSVSKAPPKGETSGT
jgi:BMFP domain-containing protein YqiC